MKYLNTNTLFLGGLGILLLFNAALAAQPIPVPVIDTPEGHYIFTVYTPQQTKESPIWHFGNAALSTHRLVDDTDSTELRLLPVRQTSLRTYLSTAAAAGTMEVVREQGSPTIEELLVYPMLLSPEQRQLTESYLAIKHGLTLNQYPPTNYLAQAADGTSYPVWDATEAPDYRQRIIGLAVDTAARLHRLSGSSVMAPDVLQLTWPEAPTSTVYLLAADNGEPTAPSTEVTAANQSSLQRRWRVQTTGPVPPTTLTFATRQFFHRAQVGENWTLCLEYADGTKAEYSAQADVMGTLVFPDVVFPANAPVAFSLSLPYAPPPTRSPLSASLSPNPIAAGQHGQLRVQLAEERPLQLKIHDLTGRLLEER
ncbi:MAG: hypothetical protein AAGF89_12225, partial [Bacteroidota bacterium]